MKLVRPEDAREAEGENLRQPLPRLAARQIQRQVEEGQFAVGERLPAQRELALRMGISRTVLREAISVLEAVGILRTEAGSGTYVAAVAAASEKMVSSHATGLNGTYAKLDICRFRHVFESACARLAAMRVTDADIERLTSNLTRFKEQIRTGNFEQSAQTDEAFHHLIVEIAGVPLFTDMHISFRQMLLDTLKMPVSVQGRGWEPVVEHERILEALKRRDPDEAVYYMQSHIMRSTERLGYILPDEVL
ncbi:MAG: GntR domain protein [Rhizobium sp.]|nr:GntR domain protein [Rhizobium sp.]